MTRHDTACKVLRRYCRRVSDSAFLAANRPRCFLPRPCRRKVRQAIRLSNKVALLGLVLFFLVPHNGSEHVGLCLFVARVFMYERYEGSMRLAASKGRRHGSCRSNRSAESTVVGQPVRSSKYNAQRFAAAADAADATATLSDVCRLGSACGHANRPINFTLPLLLTAHRHERTSNRFALQRNEKGGQMGR